jgi:hypothetical protein
MGLFGGDGPLINMPLSPGCTTSPATDSVARILFALTQARVATSNTGKDMLTATVVDAGVLVHLLAISYRS